MKTMKKVLLTMCLLLFVFVANAQEQGFSMNLTPTPETCTNNGKITVDVTGTQAGAAFAIGLYDAAGTELIVPIIALEATGTTLTYTFNSRGHGTYTVKVKEDIGSSSTMKEGTVTIANEVQELAFTVDIEEKCNGLKLTANVTTGNPVEYRLVKSSNDTEVIHWQTSNVLDFNMPFDDGQYKLEVKDNCEQIRLVELTLEQPEQPDYRVERKSGQYLFKVLKDCNHFYHVEKLYFKPWSHSFPSYRYPFQVKIEIEDPDNLGTYNTIKEETWDHSYEHSYDDIPFYRDKTYHYKITFTDACGTKFVQEDLIEPTNPSFGIERGTADCLKNNMTLGAFRYLASPYTVTFLEAPDGFDASNFHTGFNATTGTVDVPFGPYSSIEFKSNTESMPSGNYKIQITDACGSTVTKETTIEDNYFIAYLYQNKYGCGDDKAAVQMHIATNNSYHRADTVVSVKITSAPAEFESLYGPTPYDASDNISPEGSSKGIFYMNSLPTGDYTVELIGKCGFPVTKSFTLIERIFEPTVEINQKCSSFDVKVTAYSNLYREQFYLQKYNEEQGQWADPETGALYTEGDELDDDNAQKIGKKETSGPGSNSGALNTFERELLNLEDYGKYRVLYTYETHGNGKHTEVCQGGVIKEFEISDPVITINNYSVLKCTEGCTTTSTLLIDADGIKPLKYKIIKENGISTDEYPETEIPVLKNLSAAIYLIRITDDCGNTKVVELSAINKRIPKIIPDNLCEGENGKLFLSGVGFLTVKWFKEGANGIVTDLNTTGYEYKFEPFDAETHKGRYIAKLYYPSNDELCSDDEVSIDLTTITNEVEAGTGQTIDVCIGVGGFVNLFDYIDGDYNNWGTWSDINTPATDALHNELLDLEKLETNGVGSYQFKYIVEGYCTGSDEATVTLNILSCPKAFNDINQTPQGMPVDGNLLTNDNGSDIEVTSITINGVTYNVNSGTTGDVEISEVGTILVHSDGSYTFTPKNGYIGEVPIINYTIEDKYGKEDNANLKITIIPDITVGNDAPIANNDVAKTKQDVNVTIKNVMANDYDPDQNKELSVTKIKLVTTSGGVSQDITVPTDGSSITKNVYDGTTLTGTITIDKTGKAIFDPAPTFTGNVPPITYTIDDAHGGTDTADIIIKVLPDSNNSNQVFANDDIGTCRTSAESIDLNALTNDFDPEGDNIKVTSVWLYTNTGTLEKVNLTVAINRTMYNEKGTQIGTININSLGAVHFQGESSFVGTVHVPYTIKDAKGKTASATIYLTQLANCENCPLPIKLYSFEARLDANNSVLLDWTSLVELNNDYYTMYKSEDAMSWELLEEVEGAGNSSEKQIYQIVDNRPFTSVTYYKLTQTDYDGTTEELGVRSVKIYNTFEGSSLLAYPNPTNGVVNVKGICSDPRDLRIINSLGIDVTNSVDIKVQSDRIVSLNLEKLSKNIYFLQINTTVVKIIKN